MFPLFCGYLKEFFGIWKESLSNFNLNKKKLVISEALANQGPVFRRLRPRAKGQGFEIRKPSCHILISVQEKNS